MLATIISFVFAIVSWKVLLALLVGLMIGWNMPQPAWAAALWAKITKKAPVVTEVATDVVTAASNTVNTATTVVTDVATVANVAKDVAAVVAPTSTTTSTPASNS